MALSKSDMKALLERYQQRTAAIRKASADDLVKESDDQREKRIKHLLLPKNYAEFFDYYFGPGSSIPLSDHPSAPFHVDIYKDLYNKDFITLFNLIFRGGAKSTHGNLGYPFALKQSGKARFFLVVGANEKRAAMLLQDLQLQLEHNRRIIDDFGTQKSYGDWADGQFETTDRCTFMSLGIDQPARGLRANGVRLEYVSIDDVEDPKRAMNTDLCQEYANKVTGDIQGAFSLTSERTIINNNYFVEGGFISELLKRKGFDMRRIDTRHNNIIRHQLAHLYQINLTDKYYTEVSDSSDDWHPSWDRFSRDYCLRKIDSLANDKATLSNEYYNTPIKVGKLFKPSMIRWVKPLPLDQYDLIVEFWDFSYSAKGDTKAMARIGCKGARMTLLDIFCRNCDIDTALQECFAGGKAVIRLNQSYLTLYDANVAQQTIYEPVLADAAARFNSSLIPQPTHNTTDKYIKISTTLGAALMGGQLFFSESIQNHPDWNEASHQLFSFEKGSKVHDDFPDALAEAVGNARANYSGEYSGASFKPIIGNRKRNGKY